MSIVKGRVGKWELDWLNVPHGSNGMAHVKVNGSEALEVRWRRDESGVWIELPDGVYGFDMDGEPTDEGGISYRVIRRNSDQAWNGLSFVRGSEEAVASNAGAKKKGLRVRAQMPGKIVRVLVKEGQPIEKDQPLIVMEAMKMENEIRAPQSGTAKQVKVSEGQAVESGADLIILEG